MGLMRIVDQNRNLSVGNGLQVRVSVTGIVAQKGVRAGRVAWPSKTVAKGRKKRDQNSTPSEPSELRAPQSTSLGGSSILFPNTRG